VRNPHDVMRSFSRFSATGDGCGGAPAASASRTVIATEIRGSPPARMSWMRCSRDIWLSDFCSAFTSTTASVVMDTRPSLPLRGSLSRTVVVMKLPLCASSLSRSTS